MQESKSSDKICSQSVSELAVEPEKIFTAKLLVPIVAVAAYLYFIKAQYDTFKLEEETEYLFANAWWSGPIFFTVMYLLAVYFGPRYMKDRAEFQIKPFIFAYNLYQFIFNIWAVYSFYAEVYSNPTFTGLWGNPHIPGKSSFWIGFVVWTHYNNKFLELLDTMWMILRKKNKQISFLHCYHHVLLIWSWFLVCKIDTSGDVYFGASVNSFIHVIMYGYYTMALLNIPCPWKKLITIAQLAQFALVACHSCYQFYAKKAPFVLAAFQLFVMLNMLVLFTSFFLETYKKEKPSKKKE